MLYFSAFNPESGKEQCHLTQGNLKPPPPYNIKIFKGYKNVMIRRDFANFLIYHPVAIALEEYMHDAYIPDELIYPTLSRINHTEEVDLTEEKCNPWYGRFVGSTNFIQTLPNIPTWEDCGNKCEENVKCSSWSWNVPDNTCSGLILQVCSSGVVTLIRFQIK